MTSQSNDLRLGEGFAFFRWHCLAYQGDAWAGIPHPEYEQRMCRREFADLQRNLTALRESPNVRD